MLIRITEYCAWENEKWHYVLDLWQQDASAINNLFVFTKFANEYFDKAKKEANSQPFPMPYHAIFNPHPLRIFAASFYTIKFHDTIEVFENKVHLKDKETGLIITNNTSYNNHSFDLSLTISPRKMKSAMLKIRDKSENILYKNFDSIFLKKKENIK